jgi:hypothetical protein
VKDVATFEFTTDEVADGVDLVGDVAVSTSRISISSRSIVRVTKGRRRRRMSSTHLSLALSPLAPINPLYIVLPTSSSFNPLKNRFKWSFSLTCVTNSERWAWKVEGEWS